MEDKPMETGGHKPGQRIRAKRLIFPLLAAAFIFVVAGRISQLIQTRTEYYPQYTFRITRELVGSVAEARALLEKKGNKAFPMLDQMRSEQLGLYLYVYRLSDGMCLYHGENPAQVGRRLDTFTDQLGKPVHRLISRAITNPRNPHGWVHYYWHRPNSLFLDWKSSCHLKVVMPDGVSCYVGGGEYDIGAELEFARIAVADAEHLLKTEGKKALAKLLDPAGPFFFHDTAVFLLRENGTSIIDPILKKRYERDLRQFRDAVGRYPFQDLLQRLKNVNEAQIVLYARSSESMNNQKKIIFARGTAMGTIPVIAGTVIDAPRSIWQK